MKDKVLDLICIGIAVIYCYFNPRYDRIVVDPNHPDANWHGPVFKTLRQAGRFYHKDAVLVIAARPEETTKRSKLLTKRLLDVRFR